MKTLQKDLAAERAELAELKKYDPQRLRKNLDSNKKKLAEKTTAADKLQKSLSQTKAEKAELELKVKELEAQLEPLKVIKPLPRMTTRKQRESVSERAE